MTGHRRIVLKADDFPDVAEPGREPASAPGPPLPPLANRPRTQRSSSVLKVMLVAVIAWLAIGAVVISSRSSTRPLYDHHISSGWDAATIALDTAVWPLTAAHRFLTFYNGHLYYVGPNSFHKIW
jgi:hypothetical protein